MLDILQNATLTLVDPKSWEDKNDIFFMELYKEHSGYKSVLALCFCGWNNYDAEKYHVWKTYSGSTSGVCIQFESDKLISYLNPFKEIRYRMVEYLTIKKLREKWKEKSLEDLPFMKRLAYNCDSEFRIIYRTNNLEECLFHLPIKLDCISKITLNPWILEPVDESVKNFIHKIKEYEHIKLVNTTLLEYADWKKYGDKIAKET